MLIFVANLTDLVGKMRTMFQQNDIVYTFLGESLIKAIVLLIVDDLRLSIGDDECTYCVYKDCCYRSPEEAFIGMQKAMLKLRRKYEL